MARKVPMGAFDTSELAEDYLSRAGYVFNVFWFVWRKPGETDLYVLDCPKNKM